MNFFASSDQIAPKNIKGRPPSTKTPRHPITMDVRYMCRAPAGCDFSTKYEFNLTRHEVRHKKRKGGGTRPNSTKTWRNSNQSKKIKAKENNSYSLPKPLEEPRGIHKNVLLSPTKSSETAAAAKEPTETKPSSPECAKSVISTWIERRKNQQNGENNGRQNDDDDNHGDNYFKASSGKYKCKKCYYTTSFKCNMKKHFPTHSNDLLYKCHYCDYRSKWEQNVKAHEKTQHFGIPRKLKTLTTTTTTSKKVKVDMNNKPNMMAKKLVNNEPNGKMGNNEQRFSSEVSDDDELEKENYMEISVEPAEELADSTGFACTLCDFVGYSEAAALNHAKCHTQPFIPTAKLDEIPIICLD